MEITFIFSLVILVMSVVVHEVAHGYAALLLGDPTAKLQNRLTLNPLRHLDLFGSIIIPILTFSMGGIIFGWAKPVPFNPYNLKNRTWGEGVVALAGPLSNLFLALFFSLLIRYGFYIAPISPSFFNFSIIIIITNISLAVFNLVPVPPLDGSKIIFSLIPYRYDYVRRWMERYSLILVFLLIFVFWDAIAPVIPWLFRVFTGL